MHFDLNKVDLYLVGLYLVDLYIVDIYLVGSLATVQKSALLINISIGSMSICGGFKLSRKNLLMPNQGFDNSYFEGLFYSYTSLHKHTNRLSRKNIHF